MEKISEYAYNEDFYIPIWIKELEKIKLKKRAINKYNTKQALIEALRRLGLNENFVKNEVLLQYLVIEFLDIIENSFIYAPSEVVDYRDINECKEQFKMAIEDFISYLKQKLIIYEEGNVNHIMIVPDYLEEMSFKNKEDIMLYVKKMLKSYPEILLSFEIVDIAWNKQNKNITINRASYDLCNRGYKIVANMTRDGYDESCQMILDEDIHYTDEKFDIDKLEDVFFSIYNYKNSLTLKNGVGKFNHINQDDSLNYEIADLNISYDEVGFDFLIMTQEINGDSIDKFERVNNLYLQQVDFYKSKKISESEYIIKTDDKDFYSFIYDFSMETLKQIEELISQNKLERIKKDYQNYY